MLCCSFWTWHAGVQWTGDGHALDDGGPLSERRGVCTPRLTRTLHFPADALPVCQLTGLSYFSCLLSRPHNGHNYLLVKVITTVIHNTRQLYCLQQHAPPILRSIRSHLALRLVDRSFE